MRVLVLMVLMLNVMFGWSFTKKDLENMDEKQLEVYHMAKEIGYKYGLGDTLIKIAAVETRFGKVQDRPNAKHCGPMQISTYYSGVSCEALNSNLYLAMEYAAKEIMDWKKVTKGSLSKAIMMYNTGYLQTDYGKVYLSRINKVGNVLDKHSDVVASNEVEEPSRIKQLFSKIPDSKKVIIVKGLTVNTAKHI